MSKQSKTDLMFEDWVSQRAAQLWLPNAHQSEIIKLHPERDRGSIHCGLSGLIRIVFSCGQCTAPSSAPDSMRAVRVERVSLQHLKEMCVMPGKNFAKIGLNSKCVRIGYLYIHFTAINLWSSWSNGMPPRARVVSWGAEMMDKKNKSYSISISTSSEVRWGNSICGRFP